MLEPKVSKSAIRFAAYTALATCLIHSAWTWLNQPGKPALDEVVLKYSLENGGVIYGVRDNRGGATTGMNYRFYAYRALSNDDDVRRILAEEHPFMITKTPEIGISGHDEKISVLVRDQVFSFSSRTLFKNADGLGFTPVNVDLIVQTPEQL
jgi:hypothetical protein